MKAQASNQKYFVYVIVSLLLTFSMQETVYGQNLDAGEARTVRMIYFLPNDLPFRADVVQRMKDHILNAQTFYAEQMQADGYGNKTFQFETTRQGEPRVHRVNGKHPFSHYDNTLGNAVIDELAQAFDLDANIYFIVLGADALRQGNGLPAGGVGNQRGKNGGHLVVPNSFGWLTVAHELGHTFGLGHDFTNDSYLMSYGSRQNPSLSACATEFLSLHPYFNPRIPIVEAPPPTIELVSSPTYPAGSKSIPVRLKIKDSEGIHQVQLFAWGGLQECRGLAGKKEAVVEFAYDGGIGLLDFDASRVDFTSLSDAAVHNIFIAAIDTDGNVGTALFTLAEMSPNHIVPLEGHTDRVLSVAFSPDRKILASGSWDNAVKLWDVMTKENIDTFRHTRRVKSLAFSPDGTILASGGNDGINLWDMITRKKITTLKHGDFVNSMSFSRDGTTLASGGDDHTIKLWNVATAKNIATLRHGYFVRSVSFSPDGTTLVSCAWDGTIKLWDVQAETEITTLENLGGINAVLFSPDGTTFVSAAIHGTIKLWDVETRTEITTFESQGSFPSIAFSYDGETLASGTLGGGIKLWDVPARTEITTFGYPSGITSLAFSLDGTTLATGTEFGKVELWDVTSFPPRQTIDNSSHIIISEIMVASNEGQLPQWIELYNRSKTHQINLKGWTLEIQNRYSADFDGDRHVTLIFQEKSIKPQETLLIVSRNGRSPNNLRNERIYNLSTLHPSLQDVVLSEEGFYMKLRNAEEELIDEVGNLDKKRNIDDKPAWRLPTLVTEDGVRASMIRRHDDRAPRLGTEASGWISAVNTNLAITTTTYYGHPDDIGAPGIESGGALPVQLSRFRAELTDAGVVLRWTTESELDNAGFNILRSETKNGAFKIINPKLIQGAGTTSERQTYTWKDTTAKPNIVYYYRIEDISHAGVRKQLATVRLRGYVSASGKLTTSWGDLKRQE